MCHHFLLNHSKIFVLPPPCHHHHHHHLDASASSSFSSSSPLHQTTKVASPFGGWAHATPVQRFPKEKKREKKQIHQSSAGMEKEEWRDEFCGRPNLFLLPSFALLLFVSLKERLEEGKRERDSFEIIGLLLMLGRCCMDGRMSARGRRGG